MSAALPTDPQTVQDQAWIGDAILCLYAREWLLQHSPSSRSLRTELFTHFTSNQFLSAWGDPTRVEAQIGLLYQRQGLTAAYDHITTAILPLYRRQIRNKLRGTPHQQWWAEVEQSVDDHPRSV